MKLENVLIIGAGTMGKGIAQWFAQQEIHCSLTDINHNLLNSSIEDIKSSWKKLEGKKKFNKIQIEKFSSHLVKTLVPVYPQYDLIIEAVVENIKIKSSIFSAIEKKLDKNCQTILATNTSSISLEKISQCFQTFDKSNFCGIHFFNPAPIMKLVELITTLETSSRLIDFLKDSFSKYGKVPVVSKNSPGFIVNRVNRNFFGQGLVQLDQFKQSKVLELDNLYKQVAGFRMGPFELMDLIGVDVNLDVTKSVWNQFDQNPRFTPHEVQEKLVEEKRLGKKTMKGFYDY